MRSALNMLVMFFLIGQSAFAGAGSSKPSLSQNEYFEDARVLSDIADRGLGLISSANKLNADQLLDNWNEFVRENRAENGAILDRWHVDFVELCPMLYLHPLPRLRTPSDPGLVARLKCRMQAIDNSTLETCGKMPTERMVEKCLDVVKTDIIVTGASNTVKSVANAAKEAFSSGKNFTANLNVNTGGLGPAGGGGGGAGCGCGCGPSCGGCK